MFLLVLFLMFSGTEYYQRMQTVQLYFYEFIKINVANYYITDFWKTSQGLKTILILLLFVIKFSFVVLFKILLITTSICFHDSLISERNTILDCEIFFSFVNIPYYLGRMYLALLNAVLRHSSAFFMYLGVCVFYEV